MYFANGPGSFGGLATLTRVYTTRDAMRKFHGVFECISTRVMGNIVYYSAGGVFQHNFFPQTLSSIRAAVWPWTYV